MPKSLATLLWKKNRYIELKKCWLNPLRSIYGPEEVISIFTNLYALFLHVYIDI